MKQINAAKQRQIQKHNVLINISLILNFIPQAEYSVAAPKTKAVDSYTHRFSGSEAELFFIRTGKFKFRLAVLHSFLDLF